MPLKKSELYSSLWSGSDELRGGTPSSPKTTSKTLVVGDKWLATLAAKVAGHLQKMGFQP